MDEGGHCDDDAVDGGDEKDEEDGNVDVTGKGVKPMLKPTSNFGLHRLLWTLLSSPPIHHGTEGENDLEAKTQQSFLPSLSKFIKKDYNDVGIDVGWLI